MSQEDLNLQFVGALQRIETKIDLLSGPDGRIRALEKASERQWWFTMAVAPALAVGHTILRAFKLNV